MAKIEKVSNLVNRELALYSECSEVMLARYFEPEPGIFIAESDKVLLRALDAGYLPLSLLIDEKVLQADGGDLILKCENALRAAYLSSPGDADAPAVSLPSDASSCPVPEDFPVYTADYDTLKDLVGYHLTGGVLCAMRRKPLPSVSEVCRGAKRIAVLENVVNPTNIGAIFRSAAALNIDAVLLTMACCDPLYRRSIRVSMGNVFLIPWTYLRPIWKRSGSSNHWESADEWEYADNDRTADAPADRQGWPSPWLERLKAMGYTTAAMALDDDSVSVSDPALKKAEKLAIVLGTEGDGLLKRTIANCDYTVKIPMAPGVDSLNVAAASAVAFWELGKR